ncbi:PAS domain-containing protein [Aeromonas simiae]|uniref:PAS domain-containing protein n=1 Tax=Aeromonas simiae TaxID=218936 RepID=UPI000B0471E2|nr:PAS domain-containing protein [Aeromonas simiae]
MDEPLKEPDLLPPSHAHLADAATLNLQPEALGAEPSLDELKARLAAIERSHGIIEFTPDGVIERVNDHYLKLTGYPREALLGQHHSLLCPPRLCGQR